MDKWLQRWPQWPVLEHFIAPPKRLISVAWFSLLQEYEDIFNIAGDPTPADAKLMWWTEELHDWKRQRSRHPLANLLQPLPVSWNTLADALPELINARKQPNDSPHARILLHSFARCLADIETHLFAEKTHNIIDLELASQTIISQLLAQRSHILGAVAMPLDCNQINYWQQTILDEWFIHGANPRRLYSALARLHHKAQLHKKPVHPIHVLWHGWRAARG